MMLIRWWNNFWQHVGKRIGRKPKEVYDIRKLDIVAIDANVNGHWISVFSGRGYKDKLDSIISNGYRVWFKRIQDQA